MRLSLSVAGLAGMNVPRLGRPRPQPLRRLLAAWRGPDGGRKPRGLRVPDRCWRRNSALIMSLYEQDRYGSS